MRIGIVAGEASGDLLGAELMRAIRARVPDAVFEGIAGPRMTALGCRALFPMHKLAVMGLVEVLGHYRELHGIRTQLMHHFTVDPPNVFVGIDAPDFNLGLERRLKRAGIPTVHYVSPSVWAWRSYRVKKIAASVDLMLTLFPFEAAFYAAQARHRVAVKFVGHPLADMLVPEPGQDARAALRARLDLPEHAEVIALMPGSRVSELRYLAEPFVRTAAWCARRRPGLYFVAPQATPVTRALFDQALARHAPDLPVRVLDGGAHDALRAADVVLLASGTATLEALLLHTPMVVAYRMAWLTAHIARRLLRTPYYSLPNLLAGRRIVAEYTQDDVTPEQLGPALLQFLEQAHTAVALRAELAALSDTLRQGGASAQAARAVLKIVSSDK